MKKWLLFLPLLAALYLHVPAADAQVICNQSTSAPCNPSTNPGSGTQGDPAWMAFGKINATGIFSNISGVIKGNGSSPYSAATFTDIVNLWNSSACPPSSGLFMATNGLCYSPAGSGTMTSYNVVVPAPFTATNCSTTGSTTCSLSWTTGQPQNQFLATPNGSSGAVLLRSLVAADIPAISLTSGVSGILPVANGGTGVSTFTGIAKGNGASPFTTAVAADVYGLWSGCSGSNYLRSDGTCQPVVTSYNVTVPAPLTATSCSTTGSTTCALTWTTGQTQNRVLATPNGSSGAVTLRSLVAADIPTISLTAGVSGVLPVANGGIGVGTLTGPVKGNGTSAFTVAGAADIYGLWSGCTGSNFLRSDGTCQSPTGTGTVTSVAMTVPAWMSVSGTPITTSGTLALTVTGAVPAANGGTGVNNGSNTLTLNQASTFTSATGNIAPLELDANAQTANYTAVLSDNHKQVQMNCASACTFTMPANSSVAFPVGTSLTVVGMVGGSTVTVAITTDTLVLLPTGATGARTLSIPGLITFLKVASTTWYVSGVNIS